MPPSASPPPTIAANEATCRTALLAPAPSRPSTIPADAMTPSLMSTTCSRTRPTPRCRSPVAGTGQPPGREGIDQLTVITLGLVGVGVREGTHARVERPAPTEVRGDRDRVARARVRAGQHLAAGSGEPAEPRGHQLAVCDDLHVAELADVV